VKLGQERETSCAGEGDRPRERQAMQHEGGRVFFFLSGESGFFWEE
jgi:hypothetical protein